MGDARAPTQGWQQTVRVANGSPRHANEPVGELEEKAINQAGACEPWVCMREAQRSRLCSAPQPLHNHWHLDGHQIKLGDMGKSSEERITPC